MDVLVQYVRLVCSVVLLRILRMSGKPDLQICTVRTSKHESTRAIPDHKLDSKLPRADEEHEIMRS